MTSINFTCPHCSQSASAPDDFIGADVECPTCKQTFRLNTAEARYSKDGVKWLYDGEKVMARVVDKTARKPDKSDILSDAEEIHGEAVKAKSSGHIMCVLWILASAVTAFFIFGDFGVVMDSCAGTAASMFFILAIYFFISSHLLHIQAAVLRVGAEVRNRR